MTFMTENKELQKELHEYFLKRMYELGELGPETFSRIVEEEPGLLERYLRSCGIAVKSASLGQVSFDRIRIQMVLEEEDPDLCCEVRFLY